MFPHSQKKRETLLFINGTHTSAALSVCRLSFDPNEEEKRPVGAQENPQKWWGSFFFCRIQFDAVGAGKADDRVLSLSQRAEFQ